MAFVKGWGLRVGPGSGHSENGPAVAGLVFKHFGEGVFTVCFGFVDDFQNFHQLFVVLGQVVNLRLQRVQFGRDVSQSFDIARFGEVQTCFAKLSKVS